MSRPLTLTGLSVAVIAAAGFAVATLVQAPPAKAASFRICKNVSFTAVHVRQRDAIDIARGNFHARVRRHERGGYRRSVAWIGGPQCVSRRNGFHCSFWTRMCKTRRSG